MPSHGLIWRNLSCLKSFFGAAEMTFAALTAGSQRANCHPKSEVEGAKSHDGKLPASPIPLWLLGGAREQKPVSGRVFDN